MTYSGKPTGNSPPSAQIRKLIGELGLRYRPSAQADLEAHAASVALLSRDLADVPPRYLDRAIRQWVMKSPYMPKACELASLAQTYLEADKPRAGRPPEGWPWEQEDTFDPNNRCTPEQARAILAEHGLASRFESHRNAE